MPVSDPNNITPIINTVLRVRPKTVLDLGIGFGKYGVLCREYLDIEQGRLRSNEWQTSIVGYEAFSAYNNPNWMQYTLVHVKDFTRELDSLVGFDMVLMIDSLEHMDKVLGANVLMHLIQNNKNVVVSCPDGDYPQGAVNGNEYERHRAVWRWFDFDSLGGKEIHRGVCSVFHFRRNQ